MFKVSKTRQSLKDESIESLTLLCLRPFEEYFGGLIGRKEAKGEEEVQLEIFGDRGCSNVLPDVHLAIVDAEEMMD